MLDLKTLERLMACERIKDEVAAVQREQEGIIARFENLDRQPTGPEHGARLADYLDTQARLFALTGRLQDLAK